MRSHRPAVRMAVDHLVELLRAIGGRMRQRAREQRRVRPERLRQRLTGQIVLVERYHGGAALIGAAHLRRAPCSRPSACPP